MRQREGWARAVVLVWALSAIVLFVLVAQSCERQLDDEVVPVGEAGVLEVCNPDGLCWPGDLVSCLRWYVDGDRGSGYHPGYMEWYEGRSRDHLSYLTPERAVELGIWRCDEKTEWTPL